MTEGRPATNYRLTEHTREEMIRRQISEEDVAAVLTNPEQVEKPGQAVRSTCLDFHMVNLPGRRCSVYL